MDFALNKYPYYILNIFYEKKTVVGYSYCHKLSKGKS